MYHSNLGGKYKEGCFEFENNIIPIHWTDYIKHGIIRVKYNDDKYILYIPYHFLLSFIKSKIELFHFKDVNDLSCEIIAAATSDPQKRKGYCFQRAVALELVNKRSKFLYKIINEINSKYNIKLMPKLTIERKIYYFNQDKDIRDDRVYMVNENNKKKTGDVKLQRVLVSEDKKEHSIILELKNSTTESYLVKGLQNFKETVKKHNPDHSTFYIYVSMHKFKHSLNLGETGKNLMVLSGLEKEDFTIDVKSLSDPDSNMSVNIIKELFPDITIKNDELKEWIFNVKGKLIQIDQEDLLSKETLCKALDIENYEGIYKKNSLISVSFNYLCKNPNEYIVK